MKRRSLQTKIQEIAKVGTLRTYSRGEVIQLNMESFREDTEVLIEQLNNNRDAYDRGLIYCSYKPYEPSDIPMEISQYAPSLAEFVLNIVYPWVFELPHES